MPADDFLQLAAGAAALPAVTRDGRSAELPDAAAADDHRLSPGRLRRHHRAADRTMALGTARPAGGRRKPPGRRHRSRHRSGGAGAGDGYTLLLVAPANAINATLYDKLNFNFLRDIVPVAGIIRFPNVVVVNPSLPINTIPELIAYAKANPGKLNMASSGNGSTIHMSGELFKMLTGINMVHVPYRGGAPALTDLIAGQVHVMFDNVPTSAEHIKAGKLRGLAVTSTTRSAVLPELPTVADVLPGYEASAWYGLGVPKNTPGEVIDTVNKAMNAVLADPKAQAPSRSSAPRCCRARRPISASCSPTKPRSGARWSSSRVPAGLIRKNGAAIFHSARSAKLTSRSSISRSPRRSAYAPRAATKRTRPLVQIVPGGDICSAASRTVIRAPRRRRRVACPASRGRAPLPS